MSRFHSYINSASQILKEYRGEEPFSSFLKKYFAANKKFGSKDRKQVSHLCYCFFRLGKMHLALPLDERILIGLFLCSDGPNEVLQGLKPQWNEKVLVGNQEKWSIVRPGEDWPTMLAGIFPWKDELTGGIDHEIFSESFFVQPDVFIRIRPKHASQVKEKLARAGILYREVNENCLSLPSGSKIDELLDLDREAVIQDLSSQRTAALFKTAVLTKDKSLIDAWDCCAGSGGKSIMLYDVAPKLKLAVSDVRPSIMINLKQRFERAGIKNYRSVVADLSTSTPQALAGSTFDIVICDVPCTGSGTWGRTPEQLYFFKDSLISDYSSRQKRIVANAIPHLVPGSFFIYITCSVFREENEEIANFIQSNFALQLVAKEVLKGYEEKADTMFAALFSKPL